MSSLGNAEAHQVGRLFSKEKRRSFPAFAELLFSVEKDRSVPALIGRPFTAEKGRSFPALHPPPLQPHLTAQSSHFTMPCGPVARHVHAGKCALINKRWDEESECN